MSSYIAEAFVAVRADTSGIAADIRNGVALATKDYKPEIKLKVLPYVLKKDIDEFVVARIRATQATIKVTPLLDPKSTTTINEQLAAIKDQVVHVTAVVTNTTQATAATVKADQIVTPVLNQEALLAIIGKIESAKPVITVDAILDPASEAKIEEQFGRMKNQVVNVTPVSTGAVQAAGTTRSSSSVEVDKQAASVRRLAQADAELKATSDLVAKGINNETQAELANEQASKSLARVRASQAAAIKNEDVALEEQLAVRQATLVQLQEEIKARGLLSAINVTAGQLGNVPSGPLSSADADINLKKATTNATNLGLAIEAAGKSGNKNLAGIATSTQHLVDTQLDEAKVSVASAAANTAQAEAMELEAKAANAAKEQFAALTAQVERATSADFSLTQQRQRLIAVDQKLLTTINELQKSTRAGAAADIQALQALEARVAAQKSSIATQIQATAAAKRLGDQEERNRAAGRTTEAQVRRGAAATGASFLGLRGAVLSASTGFLGATIAVTGLAKIVKTAEELSASLAVFKAVAEATEDQMVEVDKKARELGADLTLPATSALDAAEAMQTLAKAGLSVEQAMDAAKGVLELAAAANISVGDAADIVATQLNAFGLAGDQAVRVVDDLAGASIAAQGDISDFALAFQQTGAVAHQVGLSFETTTAILTQFAKAGIRGSDAGTSLRTLLLRLVPTTKAAADAQAALGIHLDKSIPIGQQFFKIVDQYTNALERLGPIAQQEILTKIFGQDAIRGASVTLTQGAAALRDVQTETSKAGSGSELAAARTEGLAGAVEGLKSEVSTLAATIGTAFLPALTSTAHEFANIAQTANAAFTEANKLSRIVLPPITDIFGGVDTFVRIGLSAIAVFTARSLNAGRVAKALDVQRTAAVNGINEALQKGLITQERMNELWIVMGLSAEEAEAIQIRFNEQQKRNLKEQITLKERLILVDKQLRADIAKAGATGVAAPAVGAAATETVVAAQKSVKVSADQAAVAVGNIGEAAAKTAFQVDSAGVATIVSLDAMKLAAQETAAAMAASAEASGVARVASTELVVRSVGHEREALLATEAGYEHLAKIAVLSNEKIIASNIQVAASQAGGIGPLGGLPGRAGALGRRIPGAGRLSRQFQNISTGGFVAGIGLELAGGAIGGTAGGALSAAGAGATLGSFAGPEGALIGAAAFGSVSLLKNAIKHHNEAKAEVLNKWKSMTFAEQQQYLLEHFPNKASSNAIRDITNDAIEKSITSIGGTGQELRPLQPRQKTDLSSRLDPGILERTLVAPPSSSAANTAGRALEDRIKSQTALRDGFKRLAATSGVSEEAVQNAQKQIISLDTQIKATTKQLQNLNNETAGDFVRSMGGFNVIAPALSIFTQQELAIAEHLEGAEGAARLMVRGLFAFDATLRAAGLASTNSVDALNQFADGLNISKEKMDTLAVQAAELSGSDVDLQAALKQQQKDQQITVNILKKRVSKALTGELKLSNEEFQALIDAFIAANGKLIQAKNAVKSTAKAAEEAFKLPVGIQIQAIQAGTTKTLTDNLAASQATLAAITKAIANHANKTKEDKEAIDALRVQQAQASAEVINTTNQIADQQVQDQETQLSNAAAAAGNLGRAEKQYLAFLKARANASNLTRAEQLAAEKAYNDELKNHNAALQSILSSRLDLRQATIDNAQLRAQATVGTRDDTKVFQRYIALDKDRIKLWQRVVKSKASTQAEVIQAQINIKNLQGDIFRQQEAIKGVNGANSGFTLNDLFRNAQSQFDQFASNVSSQVTTAGGVRGALSAGILAQKPGMTQAEKEHLNKVAATNTLLSDILMAIKENNQGGGPKKPATGVGTWPKGPAGWFTAEDAKKFAKVKK